MRIFLQRFKSNWDWWGDIYQDFDEFYNWLDTLLKYCLLLGTEVPQMLFFTPPIHLTSGQGCPLSVYHEGDADPVLLVPRAVSVEADHMIRSDLVKIMANWATWPGCFLVQRKELLETPGKIWKWFFKSVEKWSKYLNIFKLDMQLWVSLVKKSFQHLLTHFLQVCINDKSWLGFTPVCLLKKDLRVNFVIVIIKWESLGGGH